MVGRRVHTVVCGMILALVAGCADVDLLSLNFLQTSGKAGANGDRVIAGSVETVAQSTQAGLAELGIATILNREDQALRIACTTRMGVRFSLVLTRDKTDRGEQTRVHLVWEDQPDEQTGTQVVAHLDAQAKK